jgi:hypothetical protein
LSGIPIVGLLAVASVWVWGWVGVVVLVIALAIWFLLKLLDESKSQQGRIRELEGTGSRLVGLESELAKAGSECDSLRQELAAPSMGVGRFLHALDDQASRLELVEKHRSLLGHGQGEFLVSAVSPDGNGGLVVRAHVDSTPTLALGEEGVLIARDTGQPLGFGEITSTSGTIVQILIDDRHLEGTILEKLEDGEAFEPNRLLVRLSGLCFDTYKDLSDATISEIHEAVRNLANSVAEKLKSELRIEGNSS